MGPEDYRDDERRLLDGLPREAAPPAGEEDRLVGLLRRDGFFPAARRSAWLPRAAAAVLLIALGAAAGAYVAGRRSLEGQLARTDLTAQEQATLLERAGRAYVRASAQYVAGGSAPASALETAGRVWRDLSQAVSAGDGTRPGVTSVSAPSPGDGSKTSGVLWF
jgi:hypothetical protein